MNPNSRGPPRRNPELRIRVLNLPARTSWQDLKDYMRGAGEVGYASMESDSVGVVEYSHKDDFEAALRKLVSRPTPPASLCSLRLGARAPSALFTSPSPWPLRSPLALGRLHLQVALWRGGRD